LSQKIQARRYKPGDTSQEIQAGEFETVDLQLKLSVVGFKVENLSL